MDLRVWVTPLTPPIPKYKRAACPSRLVRARLHVLTLATPRFLRAATVTERMIVTPEPPLADARGWYGGASEP